MPAPRLPLVFGAALLAAGGCSDRSVRHINSVPTATIVSPLEGAEVLEGSTVEMRGEVGDYEDDPEDLDIHWMVGNERVCADSSTAEASGATARNNNSYSLPPLRPAAAKVLFVSIFVCFRSACGVSRLE